MTKPSLAPLSSGEFSTDDTKLAAAALAAGGKLHAAAPGPSGRLLFCFEGLSSRFPLLVENGDVVLPARDFIRSMEAILRLVSQHQRAGRR